MKTERTVTYAARAGCAEDLVKKIDVWNGSDLNGSDLPIFSADRDRLGRRFLIHIEDVTPEPEPWYAHRGGAWIRATGGGETAEVGFHMRWPGVTIPSATQPPSSLRDELFAARDLLVKHGLME